MTTYRIKRRLDGSFYYGPRRAFVTDWTEASLFASQRRAALTIELEGLQDCEVDVAVPGEIGRVPAWAFWMLGAAGLLLLIGLLSSC